MQRTLTFAAALSNGKSATVLGICRIFYVVVSARWPCLRASSSDRWGDRPLGGFFGGPLHGPGSDGVVPGRSADERARPQIGGGGLAGCERAVDHGIGGEETGGLPGLVADAERSFR